MNRDPIKCDECGKFVAYDDLLKKKALATYIAPSNEFSDERIEFLCRRCNKTGEEST